MFGTPEVNSIYRGFQSSIKKSLYFLNRLNFDECKEEINKLGSELEVARRECFSEQEQVLNEFYVLTRFIDMLSSYVDIWDKIVKKQFSSSWNSVQDTIGLLRQVKKFTNRETNKDVDFFENQLLELEKLYPYNVFFSIGATVERFECSICGRDIDSFECPHTKGELYRGQMAYAIARNITELDHVSMVKHPEDKRCVVQYDDNGEQFKLVRFLSELITSGKLQPSDFGELKFSKRKVKNPDFQKIGRNDPCYCGSGKKFKKCCISKEFIDGDHVDIVATPISIEEMFA